MGSISSIAPPPQAPKAELWTNSAGLAAREDVLERHALDEEERPGPEPLDQELHRRLDVLDDVGVVVRLAEPRLEQVHWVPPSALGIRVSKSRRPTQSGRTAIRAMRVPGWSICAR